MAKKSSSPAEDRSAQNQFIQRLKESIPPTHSLVDELADLLQVSTDSAYRRIRGETALSIDEVTRLCSHFRIPFDYMGMPSGPGSSVTFHYHHLSDDFSNFENYLANILKDMRRIKASDPKEIIYSAEDVPIFHHFKSPLLTAFKIFYWSQSILNVSELADKKFDPAFVPDSMKAIAKEIYGLHLSIPSIEIWSEDTINSTLKQFEFYWESGMFSDKEVALQLLQEEEELIRHIERQAKHSTKFEGEVPPAGSTENYMLYNSELMIGNNCILVTAGPNKAAYLSHNTFNSMVTASPSFSEETERWLRNLIKKSILISGVAEKQRFRFFRDIQEKIEKLRTKITSGN